MAVYAQSAPHWHHQKDNVIRASFINVESGKTFNQGSATLDVNGRQFRENMTHGYAHFRFLGGDNTARLTFNEGEKNISSDFSVPPATTTIFTIPEVDLRRDEEERKRNVIPIWEGEDTIEVIPGSGEISRGLSNRVYFITKRKGVPTPMTFRVLSHEGNADKIPETITSNAFGLASIAIRPVTSLRFELQSEGEHTGKGKINLFAIATQFAFELQEPFVRYGQRIQARVESVRQSGTILVDAYQQDRWVSAEVFGLDKKGSHFNIKAAAQGQLMQVQVYNNFYRVGSSWSSQWVAIGEKNEESCSVFRKLSAHLKDVPETQWSTQVAEKDIFQTATHRQCENLLSALLASIPISFVNSTTILNSREHDLKTLNSWKEDKKSMLLWITALLFGGGFCVLLWLVLNGVKKQRTFDSLLQEDEEAMMPKDRFETLLITLRVVIILSALATFIASILMVMSFM